jgi:hypothetical protein
MSYFIARALCLLAGAFGVIFGVIIGLGSTVWLVLLIVNGEWFAAGAFVIIGAPVLTFVAGIVHTAVTAALLGLAHLINRRALEDVY